MKLTYFKHFVSYLIAKLALQQVFFSNVDRPKSTNKYPLRFSGRYSEFIISFRVHHIWNNVFAEEPSIAGV